MAGRGRKGAQRGLAGRGREATVNPATPPGAYRAIGSAVPVTSGTGGPEGDWNTASSWGVAAITPRAVW